MFICLFVCLFGRCGECEEFGLCFGDFLTFETDKTIVINNRELEDKVDGLLFATQSTETNLSNTFNKFLMLSNQQYIENRVYEEDVTSSDTADSNENEKIEGKSRQMRQTYTFILVLRQIN